MAKSCHEDDGSAELPRAPSLGNVRRAPRGGGVPATTIVREAVEGWIDDQRAKRLREEIAGYAVEVAGTGADLDPELEAAAAAELKAAVDRK